LRLYVDSFTFKTRGPIDVVDITGRVEGIVRKSKIKNGIAHIFAPHATGIICFTEYEEGLIEDIRNTLERLIPSEGSYAHPSNAHAHLRSLLFSPEKTVPIIDGRLGLGTWQSIVFIETDIYPRTRTVIVNVIGE